MISCKATRHEPADAAARLLEGELVMERAKCRDLLARIEALERELETRVSENRGDLTAAARVGDQ